MHLEASDGITPLEMAGAYATIANNGEYIEPTFYTKVEDANGKVIMEKNKKGVEYYLNKMLILFNHYLQNQQEQD